MLQVYLFDILHEIDVFSSWPGYGQLFIRILLALWFLAEIRKLIFREQSEERAAFIAHIGAGFLVWFVYLPGLGVIALFISQLWRFKIILGAFALSPFTLIRKNKIKKGTGCLSVFYLSNPNFAHINAKLLP
ncbi:unnamed protein product [Strongylus vulgaris]|uniref:GPR180/TMEM145 transmembrane domain-containing protein n=1 Tax=Strongylus vulgaris TaxID=40348 RepID=A0A3P7J260_STRVU|nr:unnamed protein product [Strongylus vulgaris]